MILLLLLLILKPVNSKVIDRKGVRKQDPHYLALGNDLLDDEHEHYCCIDIELEDEQTWKESE